MQSMVEVIGAVTSAHVMHGEQDFVFHAPIMPKETLLTTSTLVGVKGSRAGVLLYVRSETRTDAGAPVCTQTATIICPGGAEARAAGEVPPSLPEASEGPGAETVFAIGPEVTLAYADAARDYSPYTLDQAAAEAAGWPAPVVHGMLTLSLAASAVVRAHAGGDAARIARLGCRFPRRSGTGRESGWSCGTTATARAAWVSPPRTARAEPFLRAAMRRSVHEPALFHRNAPRPPRGLGDPRHVGARLVGGCPTQTVIEIVARGCAEDPDRPAIIIEAACA